MDLGCTECETMAVGWGGACKFEMSCISNEAALLVLQHETLQHVRIAVDLIECVVSGEKDFLSSFHFFFSLAMFSMATECVKQVQIAGDVLWALVNHGDTWQFISPRFFLTAYICIWLLFSPAPSPPLSLSLSSSLSPRKCFTATFAPASAT